MAPSSDLPAAPGARSMPSASGPGAGPGVGAGPDTGFWALLEGYLSVENTGVSGGPQPPAGKREHDDLAAPVAVPVLWTEAPGTVGDLGAASPLPDATAGGSGPTQGCPCEGDTDQAADSQLAAGGLGKRALDSLAAPVTVPAPWTALPAVGGSADVNPAARQEAANTVADPRDAASGWRPVLVTGESGLAGPSLWDPAFGASDSVTGPRETAQDRTAVPEMAFGVRLYSSEPEAPAVQTAAPVAPIPNPSGDIPVPGSLRAVDPEPGNLPENVSGTPADGAGNSFVERRQGQPDGTAEFRMGEVASTVASRGGPMQRSASDGIRAGVKIRVARGAPRTIITRILRGTRGTVPNPALPKARWHPVPR